MVQVGHACLEAGKRFEQPKEPCYLVVLSVASPLHLQNVAVWLARHGVRYLVFHEPDDNMGDTALCTEPLSGMQRRIMKRFRLWTAPEAGSNARAPPYQELVFESDLSYSNKPYSQILYNYYKAIL